MTDRPRCIVRKDEVVARVRPPRTPDDGVEWAVFPLSDVAGLTRMGAKIREIPPGRAGTHLHFHDLEEEWAYVLSGRGTVRIGPLVIPVRAGHFAGFPTGPRPHHFEAEGEAPLVLLEGGERRRGEDACTYPALGIRNRDGRDERIDPTTLPAFEGDARQVVHIDDLAEERRPHPLAPRAVRHYKRIDRAVSLTRQSCTWVRLEAGMESTAFHTHERSDEWIYILDGEAELRLGDDRHVLGPGDFVGHPAGSAPHVMRACSELAYLMGGERVADDRVIYPELGMQLTATGFAPIG